MLSLACIALLRVNSFPDCNSPSWVSRELKPLPYLKRTHLPITLCIMCGIKDCFSRKPGSYSNIMLWAACCLLFFGFPQVGEFTVPSHDIYDPGTHLSLDDISLDNRDKPHLIAVFIKQQRLILSERG